jgi:DNA-binding response OmpR family regulator
VVHTSAAFVALMESGKFSFTAGELLTGVWGPEYRDHAEILRTNMYRLRQKLERDPREPRHLCTRPGVGYYFSAG